jgi:NADH-quinone oxidoreductase subunit L
VPYWREAVMLVGMLSALMAALMALAATDLKRVLAYSTVSQLGYMVYAVGAGGVFAGTFHLFSHAIFKALLFLSAGSVIHAVGTRDMRLMGGLGKQMPLVRAVFIIGSLALAGLPVVNGFWSKELVLEAGLTHGPRWMFIGMVVGAGLTALYTLRCVWMVFFGQPRSALHGHDAGAAMQVALVPLALGTLVSWLLAGVLQRFLAFTLPFHDIEVSHLGEILLEVLSAPATWIALLVIALGLLAWVLRGRWLLRLLAGALEPLRWAAERSFGFEWINRRLVSITAHAAEDLRGTQTGLLNWNMVAILGALVLVIAILALGAV